MMRSHSQGSICSWSVIATVGFVAFPCQGFEDAQTLPRGVRRIMLNTFHQSFDTQSDSQGESQGLAKKLEQNVDFNDFLAARKGFAKTELESFLLAEGIDNATVVGNTTANLQAKVDVYAPSFSYGLSERWGIGLIVPIISAKTDVAMGFVANQNAQEFCQRLREPDVGLIAKSQEAAEAINSVVDTLNDKLSENGYRQLGPWQGTGVGDVMLKAKYQAIKNERIRAATTIGFAAPTGKVDDPDILTDVGYGDGTWDLITNISLDQRLNSTFFINEYAGYTVQFPAEKTVRMKTEDESIAVEKKSVRYDLGDKVEAGTSLQWDSELGIIGGAGYNYQFKGRDNYSAGTSSESLERDTLQMSHNAEVSLGYSSVNAYMAKKAAIPYAASVGYTRQLSSHNSPVAQRVQFEMKAFF